MKDTIIYIASTSVHKRRAVESALYSGAFTDQFRNLPPIDTIRSIGCESHIPKQPVGFTNIRNACNERIECVLRKAKDTNPVIVAIQSGMVGENNTFYDISLVMMRNYAGIVRCAPCAGIPVPRSLLTSEGGEQKMTYGNILAKNFRYDPENPHKDIVGIDRWIFLKQAVEITIGLFLKENLNIFEP